MLTDNRDDAQFLLQQLSDGEPAAFWTLWLRHRDRIFRLCLQFTRGSHSDAEDVLSGVMLKAFDKMALHAARIHNVGAWLCQVTRNYCIDLQRKHRREMLALCEMRHVHYDPGSSGNGQALGDAPESCPCLTLDAAISSLPLGQREVLTSRFLGKRTYEEIAGQLNLSPAAVRKRVQRARETLRQMGMDEILISSFPGIEGLAAVPQSTCTEEFGAGAIADEVATAQAH